MARKISSMGANTHSGINVDSIKNMGDAKLYDCIAETAKIMGETYCESCKFETINCMGESYFESSDIGKAKIMGETEIKNSKIKELNAMGNIRVVETAKIDNIKAMGNIYADNLECGILSVGSKSGNIFGLIKIGKFFSTGNVQLKGNFFGETLESVLSINLDGTFKFKNLIFLNSLKSSCEIECEEFYSLDRIDLLSINSEYVFIRPFSGSKVKSIVGSKVMICRDFSVTDEFKKIPKNYSNGIYEDYDREVGTLEIDIIEADEIYIENVNVNCIRGQNIIIGKNCNIKKVEYTNEFEASKDSIINEKIKEGK